MYPLVRELADDGIPVTVTCRVLKIARQPYYRWLASPVTDARARTRRSSRTRSSTRTATTPSSATGSSPTRSARPATWCLTGRCGGSARTTAGGRCSASPSPARSAKPGTPAHDDLVRREFTAEAPNRLWLADITEHRTDEGKLYLCAIKDVFSNRIVGWAIDARMKARLVVAAIEMAVARRGDVAGCILHSDRGSQFRARKVHRALTRHRMVGSMGQVGSAGDNAAMESFFALLQTQRARPAPLGDPRRAPHRDRHLDRTHLPPRADRPRSAD